MAGNTKSKLNWMAILQGWAMLLVVIGHASLRSEMSDTPWSQPVGAVFYRFAYSFHMALFVFVSGYLFAYTRIGKKRSYLNLIKSKFIKFGPPFIFFTTVGILLKFIFAKYMERPTQLSLSEFANAFLYPGCGPVSEFWFLAVLMWCFFLSPLLILVTNNRITAAISFILLAALCILQPITTKLFCANVVQDYAVYFLAGIIAQRYKMTEIFRGWKAFLIVFAAIGVYAVSLWVDTSVPKIVPALCGIIFSVAFARIADKFIPNLFSSYRNYTYQIYLLALYFQVAIRLLYERYLSPQWFYPMFIAGILAGLYLPVAISRIAELYGGRIMRLCIGLNAKRPNK